MDRTLVIECGTVTTRSAYIEDGTVVRVRAGHARGDEKQDFTPFPGRQYAARVRTVDRALGAVFVDMGRGPDGFLPLRGAGKKVPAEGQSFRVEVKVPPRQGKGALVRRHDRALPAGIPPGPLDFPDDPVLEAVRTIGQEATCIIADNGPACALLRKEMPDIRTVHAVSPGDLYEPAGIDAAFDEVFARIVPLPEGGHLVIDQTQALTAVDVDTGTLKAASPARLLEKAAYAACGGIYRQLRLRETGGHVVADFPLIRETAVRRRFREHLVRTISTLPGAHAAGFSRSGLFSCIIRRTGLSFPERFTQESTCHPVPGRIFTREWSARTALWQLERRLRAEPSGFFTLTLAPGLAAYLRGRDWIQRLAARYGKRFTAGAGENMQERYFDLSQS